MPRPVVLLGFANDRDDRARYLRNLPRELRAIRAALGDGDRDGKWRVVERANATITDLVSVLRSERETPVAIFHYGGHAGGDALLLESEAGAPESAHASGLASLLGRQPGLALVFLNGCSTGGQVRRLLDAGVRAVIATRQEIDDGVATEFAELFYAELAGGQSVRDAFDRAAASVQMRVGDSSRAIVSRDRVDDSSDWPWELHTASETAADWNLAMAAGDPLFGLPPLEYQDLPPEPFRHLQWFGEEHASLFFGRAREIRELFDRITKSYSPPITLLYGQSGAGKSSLLAAGLLPRLNALHVTRYVRRDDALGLSATLRMALGVGEADDLPPDAWRAAETRLGQPLTLIVDQVEEAFTRGRSPHEEMARFTSDLATLLLDRARRPRGRLILGFRKEWLAEIEARLREARVPFAGVFLDRLDHASVVEAITGPTRAEQLRDRYGLTVEEGLAEIIADDLLADAESPVAPTLQVLLAKLWSAARAADPAAPRFDRISYQQLARNGILLDDFVEQQLRALGEWRADVVDSGLAIDLLAFHTTELGAAERRATDVLASQYAHVGEVWPSLVAECRRLFLLVESRTVADAGTRLAHDTLAPLIRRRFEESDAPGRRARRALESRGREWRNGKTGRCLDLADLELVRDGLAGTRALTADEARLLANSDEHHERTLLERERARAALVLARCVAEEDPLAAVLQLSTLIDAPEPENGIALALAVAMRPVPRHVKKLTAPGPASPEVDTNIPEWLNDFDPMVLWRNPYVRVTRSEDHTLNAWRADGTLLDSLTGFAEAPMFTAVSDDGCHVALAYMFDASIRHWCPGSGRQPEKFLAHDGDLTAPDDEPRTFRFSADGGWLAAGFGNGRVSVWRTDGSGETHTVRTHDQEITALAFSADSRRVLIASADRTASVWTVGAGSVVLRGHRADVISASFSPDESNIVTTSYDRTVRVWPSDGEGVVRVFRGFKSPPRDVDFTDDGIWIGTFVDGERRLWPTYDSPISVRLGGEVRNRDGRPLCFSPDGSWLATGSVDGRIHVHRGDSGEVLGVIDAHTSPVTAIRASHDGTRLLSAAETGSVRLWDVATGQELLAIDLGRAPIFEVAFTPDDEYFVIATAPGAYVVRSDGTGMPVELPHESFVLSAAFNADGAQLVTGDMNGNVSVWSMETSKPTILGRHETEVRSVAFSPDGRRVASGGPSTGVRVWDTGSSQLVLELKVGTTTKGLRFSADGRYVIATPSDGGAQVCDLEQPAPAVDLSDWQGTGAVSAENPVDETVLSITQVPPDAEGTVSRNTVFRQSWGAVTVWPPRAHGRPFILRQPNVILDAVLSPNCTRLITAYKDGTIHLWPLDWKSIIAAASTLTTAIDPLDGR